MNTNRTVNPKFVEWMKHRIRLAGEEIIKRADLMTFEGFDAMTQFNIDVRIPTITDAGDIWPSLMFSAICGDATMADDLGSGLLNPYPPEQFVEEKPEEEESNESSV